MISQKNLRINTNVFMNVFVFSFIIKLTNKSLENKRGAFLNYRLFLWRCWGRGYILRNINSYLNADFKIIPFNGYISSIIVLFKFVFLTSSCHLERYKCPNVISTCLLFFSNKFPVKI